MTKEKSFSRALALYGLCCALLIGLACVVLMAVHRRPDERGSVVGCAVLALIVQMAAFSIARLLADRGNGIAGWGLGALVCFAVIVVAGFSSRAFGLPQPVVLLSLATYFSLTELIEAPFLFL